MSHTATGPVADDYVWSSWRRGFWLYWQHPLIHAGRYLGFMTRRFIPGRVVQFTDGTGNRFVSMKNNFTAMAVAVLGERDPDVMRFLRSWLRPGGVALDVGANIGTYAIPLARLVGARGRVIAFEPNRPTRACLRHNVRLNQLNNVLVVSSAVGAVSGQQGLVVTAGNAGEVHLAPRDADHGRTDVRVTTLDEEMSRLGIPAVDYIKLDIEGYELAALRGATRILRESPRLVIQTEIVLAHLQRYGFTLEDLVGFFAGLGYRPYECSAEGIMRAVDPQAEHRESDWFWARSPDIFARS